MLKNTIMIETNHIIILKAIIWIPPQISIFLCYELEVHVDVADFFGIASGNKMNDKFERTGYHALKSDKVNAPIIEKFPVVMECELMKKSSR